MKIMQSDIYDDDNSYSPVYSSRSINNDYLTLRGIELRTQITKDELYTTIPGEMMDNSIDYMEIHGVNDPHVYVTVSRDKVREREKISFLKVAVRNSVNPGSEHIFSKELLDLIYNFGMYYSSKRFYKINRGALGDASKLMLGAPYALADSMNISLTNAGIIYPLTHKTSTNGILKTFHICLDGNGKVSKVIEDEETPSQENYTEVQILLPYDVTKFDIIERELLLYLRDYAILNTHIEFTFNLPLFRDRSLHFPATQSMINAGKNLSDIRFYSLSEFRQAIGELHDKDQTIYNVLLKNFRGANNLPKNKLTQMTVGELQESPTKIDEIFELMHEKISPISSEKGLASIIPFETTKKTRRLALEERLAQAAITCDRVKYKQKYGHYESDDGIVKHPYFFEVFVGHSNQCAISNLKVMQSINSKISNNTFVFGGSYEYETDTSIRTRSSIFGIFEDYKYSHDKEKCKKRNSIVIVNLISPRIDYKSHGKSRINHIPFAKDIANTIVAACKGGDDKDGKKDQIVGLREVLKERKAEYLAIQDPIERKKHGGRRLKTAW